MRWLGMIIFALAAASSALAASGLAVPPHVDPPGTPRFHDHPLAEYRYALLLLRPTVLSERPAGSGWTLEEPGQTELGGLVLATLAFIVPALPRPTRRAVAVLPAIRIPPAEWRARTPLAPPRASLPAFA
ncbi:MAG: hypothetical protein ACYC9W_06975 [Candidatus Limnocylindria bacterium]